MELRAHLLHDLVDLLWGEVGGQDLDSLTKVVRLDSAIGGILGWGDLEERPCFVADHLELRTRV